MQQLEFYFIKNNAVRIICTYIHMYVSKYTYTT